FLMIINFAMKINQTQISRISNINVNNMKTKILSILMAGGVFLTSCSGFLDQIPDDVLTVEDIFQSRNYVDNYLTQIYANLPNETSQRFVSNQYAGPWTAASDESKYTWYFNYANNMNKSTSATTDGLVSTFYDNYYKSIRNATDFIDKID